MSKIAVIATGGKQYAVTQGDVLFVEKIDAKAGDTVKFDTLLVSDEKGAQVEVGTPHVKSQVEATVVEQTKAPKLTIIKFKAKSRYRRKIGHQQLKTKIEITKIA